MHRARVTASAGTLVCLALLGALALPVARADAQTSVTVVTNNLSATSIIPTVADFQNGSNAGTPAKSAGDITLSITNCPGNVTTCKLEIYATTVPAFGQLQYSIPAGGSGNFSCSAGSGTVTTSPTLVTSCVTNSSGGARSRSDIVVSFFYPITWNATRDGTSATSGIKFRLTVTP